MLNALNANYFHGFSLLKKGLILIIIILCITGCSSEEQEKQKKQQVGEKVKYEQIEALWRNKSYADAKNALGEMNQQYPNSELTKKANVTFTNFNELILKEEADKKNAAAKAAIEKEEAKQRAEKKQQEIDSHIHIGDRKEKVIRLWGNPEHINRTVFQNYVHEQMVYGNTYIYLENGIVTSWQDSQ